MSDRSGKHVPKQLGGPVAAVLATFCAILMAVALLSAGFAACCTPVATQTFSRQFSDFETAPYGHDQLVDLASATRDYTVDGIARDALYTRIAQAARTSATDDTLGKTVRWKTIADQAGLLTGTDDAAVGKTLSLNERYGLDETALSHLDDCYRLISSSVPRLAICAIAAFVLLGILIACGARRQAARVLAITPLALLAFLAVCGIWAAIDFYGFFQMFHALLFPQGNWTFSEDSLLICMYPLEFWVSMGCLWLAVTVSTCIIALLCGAHLKKRAQSIR